MMKQIKEMKDVVWTWLENKEEEMEMEEFFYDDLYTVKYILENFDEYQDHWVVIDDFGNILDIFYIEEYLGHQIIYPFFTYSVGHFMKDFPEAFLSLKNHEVPDDTNYKMVDMKSKKNPHHSLSTNGGSLWKLKSNPIDIVSEWEKENSPVFEEKHLQFEALSYDELLNREFKKEDLICPTWSDNGFAKLYGFHYLYSVECPDGVTFYTAYMGTKIIGCIKVYEKSDHYTIGYIDVREDYRKKGIAKKLITFLKGSLKDKTIILTRLSDMGKACHIDKCFKSILEPELQVLTYEEAVYGG